MTGYAGNIEKMTIENNTFRRVIFTGKNLQLVVMNLRPREEIGMEVHTTHDQFFRVEQGEMTLIMDGRETPLRDGMAAIVPAGVKHNVINTSSETELKIYTLYAPPQHPPGTVHQTKVEADAAEHHSLR